MYIKQVIIQGFRSYRDQTIVEPFSPKHNVVIGRNGSGKSNFFFAIQFVLSDEFSHMRPEERQQLLHEGTGPRVMSAFVEIIFDNADNRIPIDRDEVSVRRVIGAKKDSYYLDKKHVTKSDVMNLLESAGFSRSNPYYIVKQGKINQIALAPDSQRLKLLHEVAGTRVYDERKDESKGILKETEGKREKIEEMLGYIEERLSTLEEEKEELKAYQEWDKMRRSLEYTIHDKELRDTREKLEMLEETRQGSKEGSRERHEKVAEAQDKIQSLQRELKEKTVAKESLTSEKQQLDEEKDEQFRVKTNLEFDISDLKDGEKNNRESRDGKQRELAELERVIQQKQSELDMVLPQFQEQRDQEERLDSRLKACEQRRSELFEKQGRGQRFTNMKERDSWIKSEAKTLSDSIEAKERQFRSQRKDVDQLKVKVQQQEQEIKERSDDLEYRRKATDDANKEHAKIKLSKDDLQNKRRELWRQEATIDQSLQSTRDEVTRLERNLRATVSKSTNRGLDAVKKIAEERQLTGVYGPLIDNFVLKKEEAAVAVDVTAGNRLFHIVVDSDRTASQILSVMNKQKLSGEVTFLPLNKLQPPNPTYPQAKEAEPLVSFLEYNPLFHPAIMQVFGKTLICRSIDLCSHFARTANLDCITPEGDQVARKGTLTGGYYDPSRSRLRLQHEIYKLRKSLESTEAEKAGIREQVELLDSQVTHALSEEQKLETKRVQLRETFEQQRMDIRALQRELQANKKALEPKERMLSKQERDIQTIQSQLAALQAELGTELLSQLNQNEQQEVEQLSEEIQSLQQQLRVCLQERTKLESQKNTLDNLLSSNLLRRKEQLQQDLEEISLDDNRQQLEMKTAELEHLLVTMEQSRTRAEEVQAELDKLRRKIKEIETAIDKWKAAEREHQEVINEEAKHMEKLANKRSLLLKKKEESMRKIRELGSLPSDAFDKYQGLTLSQLWKKLHKANTELKKYSHVNKKALEQFISFSERKEKLTERKEQLDRDYDAIVELMDVLEQRKHEAIQFTFKQVSKNFTDVFKELVPDGKAQLVMKRADIPTESQDEDSEDTSAASAGASGGVVDVFSGVSIRVSFTGIASETKELQQLSGGQKSLVALGLIFAIQKCDPAPFYLFDEIDQALDSHHRHAVAAMIHRLADNAQFITTTFRPELLESADKFYGVTFQNKVSHIRCVSKEAAAGFIEEETADK